MANTKTLSVRLAKAATAFSRLGLGLNATRDEVDENYRNLAKQVHPDHGGSREDFLQLQADYETVGGLIDELAQKRPTLGAPPLPAGKPRRESRAQRPKRPDWQPSRFSAIRLPAEREGGRRILAVLLIGAVCCTGFAMCFAWMSRNVATVPVGPVSAVESPPKDGFTASFRHQTEISQQALLAAFERKDLTKLDLSHTRLSLQNSLLLSIPQSLRELDLAHSNVGDEIWHSIAQLKSLEVLHLDHTQVTGEPASLWLPKFRRLKTVTLVGCRITEDDVAQIPGSIAVEWRTPVPAAQELPSSTEANLTPSLNSALSPSAREQTEGEEPLTSAPPQWNVPRADQPHAERLPEPGVDFFSDPIPTLDGGPSALQGNRDFLESNAQIAAELLRKSNLSSQAVRQPVPASPPQLTQAQQIVDEHFRQAGYEDESAWPPAELMGDVAALPLPSVERLRALSADGLPATPQPSLRAGDWSLGVSASHVKESTADVYRYPEWRSTGSARSGFPPGLDPLQKVVRKGGLISETLRKFNEKKTLAPVPATSQTLLPQLSAGLEEPSPLFTNPRYRDDQRFNGLPRTIEPFASPASGQSSRFESPARQTWPNAGSPNTLPSTWERFSHLPGQ